MLNGFGQNEGFGNASLDLLSLISGDGISGQDGDNGDDHHKLNERKSFLNRRHKGVLRGVVGGFATPERCRLDRCTAGIIVGDYRGRGGEMEERK